jgi:hypothetical protein
MPSAAFFAASFSRFFFCLMASAVGSCYSSAMACLFNSVGR